MGKNWSFWRKSATKREKMERERDPPIGCMGSMFQLLNFSNAKSDYFILDEPMIIPKGVEAPKNSLDEEETVKAKENLTTPINIRIKTSGEKGLFNIRADKISNNLSFNSCSSPSANTPNLVARLMGLNHLPDNVSPSLSSFLSKHDQKEFLYQRNHSINGRYSLDIDINGSRSLPESPRVSNSRRSDVDHHRLSFQSCKEHASAFDDFESLGKKNKVKKENERESLGRIFGKDISNNTTRNKEQRRDHVLLSKPRKTLEKINKENKVPNSSLRGVKNKHENTNKKIERSESHQLVQSSKTMQKPRHISRNKKEEVFVHKSKENFRKKKQKKTSMLGEILDIKIVPGTPMFPVKKEPLSPTKLLPKQKSDAHSTKGCTHLPKRLGKPYNLLMTCDGNSNGINKAQYSYIMEVLKFLGIDENTPPSFVKLHSSSHPLHPSVFDCLELTFSGLRDSQMRHRSNRRLTFELVDEILVDVLEPYLILKPWICPNVPRDYHRDGSLLIDQLFAKIRSFQAADCRVLEDIDRLIDKDFHKSDLGFLVAFQEESETIVAGLERDIMDSLVHEILVDALFS